MRHGVAHAAQRRWIGGARVGVDDTGNAAHGRTIVLGIDGQ